MYRLIGRLEAGELSELYRAERTGQGPPTPVVVKLFHATTSDLAYARVVAGVARQLQRVTHRGVAHVVAIGRAQGRLAVVREDLGRYTLGQVLTRLYTREVYLPPAPALAFAVDLLDALQAAHAGGVVHGAVTPGNVLVSTEGRVGVSDFAALEALQASAALTRAFARGRTSYRAPELRGSERATVATDVYAAGAITYELLTLREPSLGGATVSTRNARLPAPSRLVRRLNARVDGLVMRALEASPARRFHSCGELADGLRDFLTENGGLPSAEELRRFVDELMPRDAVLDALGPVPWQEPFELEDLDRVPTLTELPVQELAPRNPFSGGEVTDRVETSDGLPVFAGDDASLETQPGVEAERPGEGAAAPGARLEWEAPAGAMPAVPRDDGPSTVSRRVKVVEDFGAPAERPGGFPVIVAPQRQGPGKIADTLVNFVTPFKRTDVPQPPDLAAMRAEGRRRARVASATGTVLLVSFVVTVLVVWLTQSPDPLGDLIRYLPRPIQEALPARAQSGPPGPPGKALKLPDFDRLRSTRAKRPHRTKPKGAQIVKVEPERPAVAPSCYAPPKSGAWGLLTVAASVPVRVDIDGVTVCGAATKLPVAVGSHRLRVVDSRSGQEYVSTTRFQAGKLVKLVPVFKAR